MKKFSFFVLLLICSGCIQVDYTGRKFAPTTDVVHYPTVEEFKAKRNQDDYILIGRFTATAGRKKHPLEVEEEVLEKSRQAGGDILCRVRWEKRDHGHYDKSDYEFGAPDPAKRQPNMKEISKFGPIVPLTADREKGTRHVFYYLLYKKKAEVKRQLGI